MLRPRLPTAYDIPLWCEPKVARDQHAQVAKALYSLPRQYVGRTLRARADQHTVRFYDGTVLVKTHPRKTAGDRSTDAIDLKNSPCRFHSSARSRMHSPAFTASSAR